MYEDFPAVEQFFVYQIRAGCGGGSWGWNAVFEAQRKLFEDFEDIHMIAANADLIAGCHYGQYDVAGYIRIGDWMYPSVDSHLYGGSYDYPVTSANILAAAYTSAAKDEVVLVFDQNMTWTVSVEYDPNEPMHESWLQNNSPQYLKGLFVLDSSLNEVESGSVDGNKVTLSLSGSSSFTEITYPRWNLHGSYPEPFLMGTNETGTLAFTSFPIADELGAEGCMDTAASNYDSDAALPCMDCCDYTVHTEQTVLREENIISISGKSVYVNTPGDHVLQIMDVNGRVRSAFRSTGRGEYSISELPPGVYIINVTTKSSTYFKKIFHSM